MRRIVVAIPIALLVLTVCGFALARYRPDLIPSQIRPTHAADSVENPPPDDHPSSLEDAPDDGWCGYLGNAARPGCKKSLPTVRLASKQTAEQIGIKLVKVETRKIAPTVSGNAEVSYVAHDYAHVTSRVTGRISAVPTDEGRLATKGEVLVIVDSAEVGSAKAQFLSILSVVEFNRVEFKRMSGLRETGAASEKEVLTSRAALTKTEAELLNARQLLLNMGFSLEEIAKIAETKDTSRDLRIIAPLAGRLVERHAVIGEAVSPPNNAVNSGQMQALFEIADLNEMWAWIDVDEADIEAVAIGQDVAFTISGRETPVFSGHVQLISFSVNAATRTVRVRAGLKNLNERLRANQYGRAVIRVGDERPSLIVPRTAIQSEAGEQFVFIAQPDSMRFRTQRVATRPTQHADEVEVVFGLKTDDKVVTSGSFLLKSEVFKESLGGD